jgi:hypothetical protein
LDYNYGCWGWVLNISPGHSAHWGATATVRTVAESLAQHAFQQQQPQQTQQQPPEGRVDGRFWVFPYLSGWVGTIIWWPYFTLFFFPLPRDSQGFDKCCFQTCSVLTNMYVSWSYGSNAGYGVGLIRHGKLSSMKHHIHTHPASPSHHLAKTYATSTLGVFLVSFQTRFGDVGNGYQRQHLHVQGRRQRILEQLRMKPRKRKRQRAQRPHKTSKATWLIPFC